VVEASRISDAEVVIDRVGVQAETNVKIELLGFGKPPATATIE
jgi:hypothetical protein